MKKRLVFILIFFVFLTSVFSRPQFFFGPSLEWGRMYPSESEYNALKGSIRYYNSNPKIESDRDIVYLTELTPSIALTYVPVADWGVGLSLSVGWGHVLGKNTGLATYGYYNNSWEKRYSYGRDDILKLSAGLRYIRIADEEKYLSFNAFVKYNYTKYMLLKDDLAQGVSARGKEKIELDKHSISLGVGLMERYDKYYFCVDGIINKDIDLDNLSSIKETGYSFYVKASCGIVFTILNENQFMR